MTYFFIRESKVFTNVKRIYFSDDLDELTRYRNYKQSSIDAQAEASGETSTRLTPIEEVDRKLKDFIIEFSNKLRQAGYSFDSAEPLSAIAGRLYPSVLWMKVRKN